MPLMPWQARATLSHLDEWLLGYQSVTPSVVHKAVWAGQRMGMRDPTLAEYRMMQGAALASDIGFASLLGAMAVEGTPWEITGTSRALTRFQLMRLGRYARLTPAGIAATFVFIAATNWTRDPSLAETRKASWAAEAARFN